MSNQIVEYRHTDEYEALITECQAIITEGIWNYRVEKILAYGRLGERVSTDPLYKKYGKGNLAFLEGISEDVGISYSDICRAIQFYEKFQIVSPESAGWDKLKEGKNISWSKIKTFYLPAENKKECDHVFEVLKVWRCKKCRKVFMVNPNEK